MLLHICTDWIWFTTTIAMLIDTMTMYIFNMILHIGTEWIQFATYKYPNLTFPISYVGNECKGKQAGAELGQAQYKIG